MNSSQFLEEKNIWHEICTSRKEIFQLLNIKFLYVEFVMFLKANNKTLLLALTDGLWIGITLTMLSKLTMVEESLITHYHFHTPYKLNKNIPTKEAQNMF